jgi:F0F1-type ATP synthase membrane subunit c/vacuolar-type H+-ATPase subunit K
MNDNFWRRSLPQAERMDEKALDSAIRNRLRALALIWVGIFISVFFFLLVTLAFPQPAATRPNYLLALLMGGLALGACALAFSFRRRATEALQNEGGLIALQQGYLVSFAMAEAPAMFGVVVYFVSGIKNVHYLFMLLSFIVLLAFRPKRDALVQPRNAQSGNSTFGK